MDIIKPFFERIGLDKDTKIDQSYDFLKLIQYNCVTHIPYENIDVVDRIGSGDAYVAGALYGLCKYRDIVKAARYGDAMASLKDTVLGDMTQCDLLDIERIIKSHTSTGPKDEMVR